MCCFVPTAHLDEVKWNIANAPCQLVAQRCSSWNSWYRRNKNIVLQLAMMLNRPADNVAYFLYELTLQSYGRLLNPKGAGWNWCRVPYCMVDICEQYFDIFDRHGNLIDPQNPSSLIKLLNIMKFLLNGGELENMTLGVRSVDSNNLDNTLSFNKFETDINFVPVNVYSSRSSQPIAQPNGKSYAITYADSTRSSLAAALPTRRNSHAKPDIVDDRNSSQLDKYGRRLAQGSGHSLIKVLRSQRAAALRVLLREIKTGKKLRVNALQLEQAIREIDLSDVLEGKPAKAQRKMHVYHELSQLYSSVVAPKQRRLGKKSSASMTSFSYSKPKRSLKSSKSLTSTTSKTPQKKIVQYFGDPLPVLVHQPYDENKPWTWIHHPHRMDVQQDGTIGASLVTRHKRDSVAGELDIAHSDLSVHRVHSYPGPEMRKRRTTKVIKAAFAQNYKRILVPKKKKRSTTLVRGRK